jgi:hypothetical protein
MAYIRLCFLLFSLLLLVTGCLLPHRALNFCGRDRPTVWQEFATPRTPTEEINQEDRIRLIETPTKLADKVIISLDAQEPVRWWKQIQVMDANCHPIVAPLITEEDMPHSTTLALDRAQVDHASLFISKAKALGIHTGMHNTPKDLQTKIGRSLRFVFEKD